MVVTNGPRTITVMENMNPRTSLGRTWCGQHDRCGIRKRYGRRTNARVDAEPVIGIIRHHRCHNDDPAVINGGSEFSCAGELFIMQSCWTLLIPYHKPPPLDLDQPLPVYTVINRNNLQRQWLDQPYGLLRGSSPQPQYFYRWVLPCTKYAHPLAANAGCFFVCYVIALRMIDIHHPIGMDERGCPIMDGNNNDILDITPPLRVVYFFVLFTCVMGHA